MDNKNINFFFKKLILYSSESVECVPNFINKELVKEWEYIGMIKLRTNEKKETVTTLNVSKDYLKINCQKYNIDYNKLPKTNFCICSKYIYNQYYIRNRINFKILPICLQCCENFQVEEQKYKISSTNKKTNFKKYYKTCYICYQICISCNNIKDKYSRFCTDCQKKIIRKQIDRIEKKYKKEEYLNIFYSIDSIFFVNK